MEKKDIAFLSLVELSEIIGQKEVSPVEVVESYLERIDSLNFKFNSYLTVCREEALQSAREAEQAIAQGDSTAAAAVYTAEAKHYDVNGTTASGAEAIAAVYQGLFDLGINGVTIGPVATTHHGDVAWQIGRSTFTGESEEGAALMLKGEFAILLMQEDDMWKVHRLVAFAPRHAPSDDDMTSDNM